MKKIKFPPWQRVIRLGISNIFEYLLQAIVTTSTKRRKKPLIKIYPTDELLPKEPLYYTTACKRLCHFQIHPLINCVVSLILMACVISLFVYTNIHLNCIFYGSKGFGFIKFNSTTGFSVYSTTVLAKMISTHSQSVQQEVSGMAGGHRAVNANSA